MSACTEWQGTSLSFFLFSKKMTRRCLRGKQNRWDTVYARLHLLCQYLCPSVFQLSSQPSTHHPLHSSVFLYFIYFCIVYAQPPIALFVSKVPPLPPCLPACIFNLLPFFSVFNPKFERFKAEPLLLPLPSPPEKRRPPTFYAFPATFRRLILKWPEQLSQG